MDNYGHSVRSAVLAATLVWAAGMGGAVAQGVQDIVRVNAVAKHNEDNLLKIAGVAKVTAGREIFVHFKDAELLKQASDQGLLPKTLGEFRVVGVTGNFSPSQGPSGEDLTPSAVTGARIGFADKAGLKGLPLWESLQNSAVPGFEAWSPLPVSRGVGLRPTTHDAFGAGQPEFRPTEHQDGGQELPYCLENAKSLTSSVVDRRFHGFRWVRADGSTCDPHPSDKVHFMTYVGQGLVPPGGDRNQPSYTALLESKEFKRRRDFVRGNEKVWYADDHDCGFQSCSYRRYYDQGMDCGYSLCSYRSYMTECGDPLHYGYRRHYSGDCGILGCSHRQHYSGRCSQCSRMDSHYHASSHYHWTGHYHYRSHWHYTGHHHYFEGNFFNDTDVYTGKTRQVKVLTNFAGRDQKPVFPWEQESFGVSFNGTDGRVELKVADPSYEYAFPRMVEPDPNQPDSFVFNVTVGPKILTPADSGAIQLVLYNEGGTLEIRASDKWGRFYQGEETDLRILMKKTRRLWTDSVVMDATVTVPAAEVTKINLSDPKWRQYLKEDIQRGAEYYVPEWSFRRNNSKISEGHWIKKGEANRIKL